MTQNSKITKTVDAVAPVTAAKELKVRAVAKYDSFEDKDTHEQREYVAVMLENPFPEEDFENIRLAPRWDRDNAIFKFRAKKYLKTAESLTLAGHVEPRSYKSKRTGKQVTYAAILVDNPFAPGYMEFAVKGEGNSAVFAMLVSELWGEKLSEGEPLTVSSDEPA